MKITKLILENFRNYPSKKLEFFANLILFSGKNGAGKTNILEALSLLGKNTPLRGADFDEMLYLDYQNEQKAAQFTIFANISDHETIDEMGISYEKSRKKKIIQINGQSLNSKQLQDYKSDLINFIWLTPSLEMLLISPKSERRDYLDKIVCDIDVLHIERVNSYQKSLKERLLILQKYKVQNEGNKWLEIVENKIVELGASIAHARVEAIEFFNKAINSFESNFPKTKLKISGEIEAMLETNSALQIENFYKEKLKNNRIIDLENFKTNFGVHRSDFSAIFLNKNAPSSYSSTGEQKAIMIGLTLARAKISSTYKNQPTILIFDEIVSHLDDKRKSDLFNEISQIGLQGFFSATNQGLVPQQFLQDGSIEVIEIS